MKLIILILTMATKAIAFEQIYALNCGGEAHTDSDGIVYQTRNEEKRRENRDVTIDTLDIGTVPKSDRPIYYSYEYAGSSDNPLIYHLPLESDGTYVLIAKLISLHFRGIRSINMKLNDIQLLSNVDPFDLCGGGMNGCDQYFYICVADKKLYYGNQSFLVKDNQIRVEFSAKKDYVRVAGLVMLKGSLGERKKLIGSATQATMFFDPLKTNSACLAEIKEKIELQNSMEISEQSLKNISNLNANSVCKTNENILQEIKNIQNDQCHGTNMKKLADQTNKIIETLQSNVKRNEEMTIEGNKKIETLQADIKKVQADNKEVQADIKSIEKTILEVKSEQASMKLEMSDMAKKLDLLLNFQTNRDSFIYFDSPEIGYSD
jgi:Malectin domain